MKLVKYDDLQKNKHYKETGRKQEIKYQTKNIYNMCLIYITYIYGIDI